MDRFSRDFSKKQSQANKPDRKRTNSPKRNCIVCKKKPVQVQCLHCSEHVCLECAQQHVNLVGQESGGAMHLLNEKIDVLDRIAANTRQKILVERDKIVQQADVERDRSFTLLAQMIEEEKQRIRNKNKELNDLPLNEIPIFIRQLNSDVQNLTDTNDSLFNVNSSMPRITLQRQNEQANMQIPTRQIMNIFNSDGEDHSAYTSRQKVERSDTKTNKSKMAMKPKYEEDDVDRNYAPRRQNEKRNVKHVDIQPLVKSTFDDDSDDDLFK